MKRVIKVELSPDSIDDAINEIEQYREGLENKLKIFVGTLTQKGVKVAKMAVVASRGDSTDAYVDYTVDSTSGEIITATIFLQGTEALFIEFGAGIAYNTGQQHPMAGEFGYGVGTYPSKHPPNKAMNPGYWWYKDENGQKQRSIGTEATMPIYKASETVRNNIIKEAINVFRKG